MARAWFRFSVMPGWLLVVFLSLVAGLYSNPAGAQQSLKQQTSPVPRQLILPEAIVAGAPATLAVLDSQGSLVPNVVVELPGQRVTTDATGRALFKAPTEPGTMNAKIAGHAITASTSVVNAENLAPHAAPGAPPSGVNIAAYPRAIAIHDRFSLEGYGFRGAADANRVTLNGDPCLVLASSPVSLVVLPGPHVPIGEVPLRINVGGTDAGQFPVSAVMLEINGPTEAVSAGSTGKLIVRAIGTKEPLPLEVRNASPGVIQLAKGNVQRLKTSGGEENSVPVDVKFVTGGNYLVSARLLSEEADTPDFESARMRLTEARKIASGSWPARIDSVLLKIDHGKQDLPQIRAELRSMLNDKPEAPVASLLDSAYHELN